MKTIHISASRSYDVMIGAGLLADCGALISAVTGACTAALIADSTVSALYGEKVKESLRQAGFRTAEYVFPAGEESKTLSTWQKIVGFLADNRLSRSDIVVALGGGVTGDMAGFAAASYQRGIRFVQIPTTLLAAVDSSVGGKTAVDLPQGKNLVGAFWQPSLVLCDTDTLRSLPKKIYIDGCAEVIKCGVLGGENFFAELEKTLPGELNEAIIARCIELKRDIVAEDEFDTGRRHLLNLGHTAAHAAEILSEYTVSHGSAVAMGLVSMARTCRKRGICPSEDAQRIEDLIRKCALPTELPYSADALCDAARADKKRVGDSLPLVVIEGLGRCTVQKIDSKNYAEWLRQGGAE